MRYSLGESRVCYVKSAVTLRVWHYVTECASVGEHATDSRSLARRTYKRHRNAIPICSAERENVSFAFFRTFARFSSSMHMANGYRNSPRFRCFCYPCHAKEKNQRIDFGKFFFDLCKLNFGNINNWISKNSSFNRTPMPRSTMYIYIQYNKYSHIIVIFILFVY